MAEQRQPFRFRLPWLPAPAGPRPNGETQAPNQTTAATLAQRPLFRPPGPAPVQPAQVQAPRTESQPPSPSRAPRTESQPLIPSRAATQPQTESQPPTPTRRPARAQTEQSPSSPSRAPSQTRDTSQPTSPSRAATQLRGASQPPSPLRPTTQPRAASQPSSPSRPATQIPPSRPSPKPKSPPRMASQSPGPTTLRSQASSTPDTTIPDQPTKLSSPSRPATQIPPSRPSPKPKSPPRMASQSPGPTTLHSQASSTPDTTIPDQPTKLSSPSRPATQIPPSRPSPKPKSPPRMASQSPGPTTLHSQASSAPDTTSPDQPTKLFSPSNEPKPMAEELSQPAPISTQQPYSSASQQEAKLEGYQSLRQEPEPKPEAEVSPEIAQETQKQTPIETSEIDRPITQPPLLSDTIGRAEPMPTAADNSPPQKSDSSAIVNASEPVPQTEERPKEIKKEPELMREEITNHTTYEETKPRTVDELPTAISETQPIQQLNPAFEVEEKQLKKQEIPAKEEGSTSAGSDRLQIKEMTSTNPKNKVLLSDSHPNHARSNGEQASVQKQLKNDIIRMVNKMALGNSKQPIDERPITIITLTGENKGAFMHMGSESVAKEAPVHIHRSYKSIPDESTEATTDGERSPEHLKDPTGKEESANKAYINSNVQSINNSILFYGSVTERNPGVHLLFSQRTVAPLKTYSRTETVEKKDEFAITPAEKLTYEPRVRRRCLRGLFMEPSDSDPDNPDKPPRHGCRYNCGEKRKRNEVDIL